MVATFTKHRHFYLMEETASHDQLTDLAPMTFVKNQDTDKLSFNS